MAGNLSDYLEGMIIESTFRGAAFTVPAKTYISLHTASPTDANTTSTEVAAAWYARQDAAAGGAQNTGWVANSQVSGAATTSNAKAISFPAVTGSSVTVTHIGIYDALSGGNLLWWGPLATSKTLNVGDVMNFAIGSIVASLD